MQYYQYQYLIGKVDIWRLTSTTELWSHQYGYRGGNSALWLAESTYDVTTKQQQPWATDSVVWWKTWTRICDMAFVGLSCESSYLVASFYLIT